MLLARTLEEAQPSRRRIETMENGPVVTTLMGVNFLTLGSQATPDPTALLPPLAPELRASHTYFWLYSGSTDPLRRQNAAFATELSQRVLDRYRQYHG